MVTIRDVARAAGVSIATASRALHKGHLVAPGTREGVRAAADRLHYSPEVHKLIANAIADQTAAVLDNMARSPVSVR